MRRFGLYVLLIWLSACGGASVDTGSDAAPAPREALSVSPQIIYPARTVITMDAPGEIAQAVAVEDGIILGTGSVEQLQRDFAGARLDERFADKVIIPGLIDPHVHVFLGSMQYALPVTPPWPMAMPSGLRAGIPNRDAFLLELQAIEGATKPGDPVIVYGYHNLVHGDLNRGDLDAITTERPLIVWHYSSHDFYLNSAAIAWTGASPDWAATYHGVDLDADGNLTGRIYEDAALPLFQKLAPHIAGPDQVSAGFSGFTRMLNRSGVTTIAEMGYGLFGFEVENANIAANWSLTESGYRLYLVPEHRALKRDFGEETVQAVQALLSGEREVPAPILPQVKFFTDAAYYSQTMRLKAPGYLSGQSKGSEGLWVTQPEDIAPMLLPYWQAGLDIHIHSNGDAAQSATLDALAALRADTPQGVFVIEHGGLFSPEQARKAGELGAIVSAASHYVFYMGDTYTQALGPTRAAWITPLASLTAAGSPVTLHSDAPLAPPDPLRAAGAHMTRATREGGKNTPGEALSAYEALEAITLDAARALRLENEIGSIAPGKKADFTILEANPLETPGEAWSSIPVWGVVLDGTVRPAMTNE